MKENNEQDLFLIPKFKEDELFKVPEGFFDTLPEKAMAAVRADEAKRGIARRKLFYYISSAAAVALVVVLMVFFFQNKGNDGLVAHNNNNSAVENNSVNNETQPAEVVSKPNEVLDSEDVTVSVDNANTGESRKNTAAKPVRQVCVASAEVVANAVAVENVAVENVAAVTPEVSEPAAPQDDTPIYACSTDLDDMCYIDYQFLEYYSDELEDSEYGDIR